MMSGAVLNPHHARLERSEDISRQLRSWSRVVLNGTQQHAEVDAVVTVNRYPLPVESKLWMATRTVDKSKLWSENSAGVRFAEGVG